jgi:membrane associated rhomboid family serine protease
MRASGWSSSNRGIFSGNAKAFASYQAALYSDTKFHRMNQHAFQPPTQFSVFPPVIKNLLIINGLMFFAQMTLEGGRIGMITFWLALWPLDVPNLPGFPSFWPWQVLTYGFLHGGFGHILFNMFALWMFGAQIENAWGSQRFLVFYFVCVIGAGLIQLIVATASPSFYPTVGASGGVFGILLAFGMMYPNQPIYMIFFPVPIKAKYFVMGYGALELFLGVTGTRTGVAHFAHLGGMLFGFLLIMYWRGRLPIKPGRRMHW